VPGQPQQQQQTTPSTTSILSALPLPLYLDRQCRVDLSDHFPLPGENVGALVSSKGAVSPLSIVQIAVSSIGLGPMPVAVGTTDLSGSAQIPFMVPTLTPLGAMTVSVTLNRVDALTGTVSQGSCAAVFTVH
jgi:hypothetical protein